MKRPAVQRIMQRRDSHAERLSKAARQMVDSASGVLAHLTTGKRGSRSIADHERFEAIVAALTPDDACELNLISTMEELLGIHHEQIERALVCHMMCHLTCTHHIAPPCHITSTADHWLACSV